MRQTYSESNFEKSSTTSQIVDHHINLGKVIYGKNQTHVDYASTLY